MSGTNGSLRSQSADDDDEFEFENFTEKKSRSQVIQNQHYDEAFEASEGSIDESSASLSPANTKPAPKSLPAQDFNVNQGEEEEESEEEEDETSTAESAQSMSSAKLYNPNEFKNLNVSSEIQDLFDYIDRYKPLEIELDTKLKPFIPDYIPAIGEIDAFLKVPRPDSQPDGLGLSVLDEPAAQQSDPTVLDLKLRVVNKQTSVAPMQVRSIEQADKNPKKITAWITNIEEVHRQKPAPHVNYTKQMPDIEQLMQAWPTQFEEFLKTMSLPNEDIDMDVADFARMVCALLDIPVYDKITESLHVLFTLYSEFKSNSHFQH